MEIIKGIEAIGKSLWLKRQKILVIADLHIGYEEYLNEKGILVPRSQFNELKKEIEVLLKKLKPKLIIINGDLKHEFGRISAQEWKETLLVLDLLLKKSKVILIKGNHDAILGPIASKKNIEIADYYLTDKICITHGNKILNIKANAAKLFIIAHEHPAVSLKEGAKKELYKCFLLGSWRGKKLIVMPSFMKIPIGSDVLNGKFLSPFLKNNRKIRNFEVFVAENKIYRFGKIKNISKLS